MLVHDGSQSCFLFLFLVLFGIKKKKKHLLKEAHSLTVYHVSMLKTVSFF